LRPYLKEMKKSILIGILSVMALTGCKIFSVTYKTYPPEIPLRDSIGTVVVIDAADTHTPGIAITKKREEVVTQIKHDFVYHLPSAIRLHLGNPAVLDTSLSDYEKYLLLKDDPSIKQKIFDRHHAAMIIILKDCSGGFNQDEVVSEKNTDGSTSKTAYYSVFFQSVYHIIQEESSWNKYVTASKKHSKRNVLSGLLARGPGYAANKKDIAQMSEKNAVETTNLFREQRVAVNGWSK
jgi:hypothetical protein